MASAEITNINSAETVNGNAEIIDGADLSGQASLGYQVHLHNFEGPLDLLLFLIKEAKIDIKDVFISEVTVQYLSYMEQVNELDLEKASEFLSIAATLLEIKSGSLLPKIEDVFEETEDPAKKIIRQLEEYKMLKEAGEKLKMFENVNRFYKIPDDSVFNVKVVLKDMTLEGLLDALSKLMVKVSKKHYEEDNPKEIVRDPYTVEEKTEYIKQVLAVKKQVSFIDLFNGIFIKSEIITTFQALLELMRWQCVTAVQNSTYDDILITLCEEVSVG